MQPIQLHRETLRLLPHGVFFRETVLRAALLLVPGRTEGKAVRQWYEIKLDEM